MLQWGVGTSLKCDWRAAEAVETDAVEAMPPWLALKWSGPLYTFQSHEIFMAVYLSPSSTQQLGGGRGACRGFRGEHLSVMAHSVHPGRRGTPSGLRERDFRVCLGGCPQTF